MAITTISRTEQIRAGTAYKWITNNASGVLQESTVTGLRAVASDANGLPVASATTAAQLAYLQDLSALTIGDIIRVSSGGNLEDAGIAAADLFLRTGSVIATGDFDLGNNSITNLSDPTAPQDAATKFYVDSIASGLDPKASCNVGSLLNIPGYASSPNNGTFTIPNNDATYFPNAGAAAVIDGITVTVGARILVKNQSDAKQNGIYSVTVAGVEGTTDAVLTRSTDMDGTPANEVSGGNFTFVENGTQAGSGWVVVWDGIVVLNTDPINWTQFSDTGSVTYVAGAGMTQTGVSTVTFDVVSANTGITVNTNDIALTLNTTSGLEISTGLRIKSDTVTTNTIGVTITTDGAGTKFDANSFVDSGSETLALASGVAGAGLSLTAGVLSVNVDDSTLEIATDTLQVKAGGITNTQISASAAIAFSKLASLPSANILVGSAGNVATAVPMSGDVTISNTGVTSISGGLAAHFVTREVPAGTVDGVNDEFTLANTVVNNSEMVFLNGILQNAAGNDYTFSAGDTITFTNPPASGSIILVSYQY